MSEVRLVVAILVPAIFTLILKDFFDLFMTNRYEGKVKQYTIWMLYFLLDTVISMNFKFVGVISMLYSFIILIAFCAVLYRDDIKYITLTVLFIICIGAASELIVALGIRAFLNSSQLQQFSLFGSTCSKLIILIIVRIVKLFRVSGIKRLDYMNWLANVSMTAGSLYIVYNLYLLSLNETKLLGSTMSSIIILLLNVICFKMFDKIAADAEIKRKNDIYKQSIDIYKREMEEREEHNEKLRRFRHDIKNHLIAIEKLALSKEYDRLRDYIHQLTDEKGVLQVTTISGNALIDGLLADKFDVARKYEIAVEYHIEIPTKLPFDDADLCIIVGNALDNAIDGTKDIEGAKKIEISMGFKQGNFLLKVKNTFNPELIKFDNNGKRLRTSKIAGGISVINIAVCDDDLEITKSINKLLMKYQDERDLDFTVDLFNDGSGLKSSILKGKKYDLIYLDIEMRQMNGIATAKYIRSIDTTVLLIYVSNYDNYLKELFEVEPFRFMSKPINDKRFYMFLDLAIDRIRSANGIYCFRFNKDILTVILRDVIYFESCGSRVHIVLKGKQDMKEVNI